MALSPDPGAAAEAGWDPPERIAALAWGGGGRRLRSRLPAGSLIAEAGDDGAGLVLLSDPDAPGLDELAARRLAPLDDETPASRARLAETLRSWLDHQREVAKVAAELHVHPQTVRYRLARLRDRYGALLEDPEARFELALALRNSVSAAHRRESIDHPSEGANE